MAPIDLGAGLAEFRGMFTDGRELLDIFLRAMNVGAALMIAGAFLAADARRPRNNLGALFTISAACYLITSAPALRDFAGPWLAPVQALAIVSPVLFWHFAQTLFDDNFRWRRLHFLPLGLTTPLVVAHFALATTSSPIWPAALWLSRAVMAFCYGHAVYVALRFAPDDLVEGRRRVRFLMAILVSLLGVIVLVVESSGIGVDAPPPMSLLLLQSFSVLTLTLGFGWALLTARPDAFGPMASSPAAAPAAPEAPRLSAADRPVFERLTQAMEAGAWREEGLSVAALAARVGVAEHQLRKLINGALGWRNFSAFLADYRISAAKLALSDPQQARRQVLQIALDVGYGSIAPFNRAFKEATGQTPSEFRKGALSETE
jgi:AraC-like DNA-binding protein